jgi:hypothetical protein
MRSQLPRSVRYQANSGGNVLQKAKKNGAKAPESTSDVEISET